MDKLIEALQTFLKYANLTYPTRCGYEALYILVKPDAVSEEDKKRLCQLGFFVEEDYNCFMSFRYG